MKEATFESLYDAVKEPMTEAKKLSFKEYKRSQPRTFTEMFGDDGNKLQESRTYDDIYNKGKKLSEMQARCEFCGQRFDSHEGGYMLGRTSLCDICAEQIADIFNDIKGGIPRDKLECSYDDEYLRFVDDLSAHLDGGTVNEFLQYYLA